MGEICSPSRITSQRHRAIPAFRHGWILDIHERTGRAVACIIGGRHSTIATEELEPVCDLDGRQVLGQGGLAGLWEANYQSSGDGSFE